MSPSLDRLRIALKFSLWTWALYWPGGGLLLLFGGLDPVGIAVTFTSLGAFLLLLASGALKANSSRNLRQFLMERPLYLVGALAMLIGVAAILPDVEAFALLLFATAWFGGLALVAVRLRAHLRADGKRVFASRADQLLVVLALSAFFSLLVFLDALLPVVAGGSTLGSPTGLVAVCTWMNLLYPALVMVAARPFREPVRMAFWRRQPDPLALPAQAPVAALPASAAAAAPVVAGRRRKAPFRAS